MDDTTAIAQIAMGDMEALTWLYKAHRLNIYRLAFMMTKHATYTEDITQDVFLTVVEKAHTYKKNISVKAWLLKITRNKTLNFLKSQSRNISLDEILPNKSIVSDNHNFEFLDILKCLSLTSRQIVLFHIVYELNHKEISRILNISHNAVRKQYERALTTLKIDIEKG